MKRRLVPHPPPIAIHAAKQEAERSPRRHSQGEHYSPREQPGGQLSPGHVSWRAEEELKKMERKREMERARKLEQDAAARKKEVDLHAKFAEMRARELKKFRHPSPQPADGTSLPSLDSPQTARRHAEERLNGFRSFGRTCKRSLDGELSKWLLNYVASCAEQPEEAGKEREQAKLHGWFEGKGWLQKWPLHYAAMMGEIEQLRIVLTSTKLTPHDPMKDWNNCRPVQVAAYFGRLDAVITLIQAGADIAAPPNKAGHTARSDAERKNHQAVVTFLDAYEEHLKEWQMKKQHTERTRKKIRDYKQQKAELELNEVEEAKQAEEAREETRLNEQKEFKRVNDAKAEKVKKWRADKETERKEKERASRKDEVRADKERRRVTANYLQSRGLWNDGLGDPDHLYATPDFAAGPMVVLSNDKTELYLYPDATATVYCLDSTKDNPKFRLNLGTKFRLAPQDTSFRTSDEVALWGKGVLCGPWALALKGDQLAIINSAIPAANRVHVELSGSSNGWVRYRSEQGEEFVIRGNGTPSKQHLVTSYEAFSGIQHTGISAYSRNPHLENGSYTFKKWSIVITEWDGRKCPNWLSEGFISPARDPNLCGGKRQNDSFMESSPQDSDLPLYAKESSVDKSGAVEEEQDGVSDDEPGGDEPGEGDAGEEAAPAEEEAADDDALGSAGEDDENGEDEFNEEDDEAVADEPPED